MDSEVVHGQVHENDEYQPDNVGSQLEEQHSDLDQKKSVLNKVKAKAKKIKATIKKHGQHVLDHVHENSNGDQNSPDDHDMNEDEKMAEDQEVDGAPVDESEDVKGAPPTYEQVENFVNSAAPELEQVENLDKSGVSSGGTTDMGEEPHHKPRVVGASSTTETNQDIAAEPAKTFAQEEKAGHFKGNLERPTGLDEDLRTPGSRTEAYTPPNYQTKANDPTGTVDESEADQSDPPTYEQVEEFVKSAAPESEQVEDLDKSGLCSGGKTTVMGKEPHHETRVVGASPTTETNEDIATEIAKAFAEEEKPGHYKGNWERPTGLDEDPRMPGSRPEAYILPNYQTEVTDPTGTDNDDIKITPVEKSFESIIQDEPKFVVVPKFLPDSAETQNPSDGGQGQFVPKPDPEHSSATKIEHLSAEIHEQNLPELSSATKIQYPPAGISERLIPEIATATETQYPSGESHDQFASDTISTTTNSYKENPEAKGQTFNNTTATVEEQPSYESVEKPSNRNSYTDEISSATRAIAADTAVSAEDALVSKNGYGEKGDGDNKMATLEEEKREDASKKPGSTLEYGKNIASSLTEKLAPVYGKVAGVGSAVKSKVSGTRTGDSVGVEAQNVGKEQDKGVSVKNYLAEKLKPGEEDKALSEVISEALYKRKEEPKKAAEDEDRDVTEVVSDAIHKQEPVEKEHGHLGGGSEKSDTVPEESHVSSPGKSVVGKIKGVVGSWFGKSEENQSPKGGEDLVMNKNAGVEVEQASRAEGETRLQE